MSAPVFWGTTISSERSTLVRRCPSDPDLFTCIPIEGVSRIEEQRSQDKDEARGKGTYGVSGGKLLFRSDNGARALGLVQSSLSTDNGFPLGRSAAGFAADFSHGIPVVSHNVGMGFGEDEKFEVLKYGSYVSS